MNERFEHITKQVDEYFDDLTIEFSRQAWMEKFAELIVRECMRMCDVAAIGYESHNHFKEANGCYSAKEYIEEHFGVEE